MRQMAVPARLDPSRRLCFSGEERDGAEHARFLLCAEGGCSALFELLFISGE
jgi:hypothetical protein